MKVWNDLKCKISKRHKIIYKLFYLISFTLESYRFEVKNKNCIFTHKLYFRMGSILSKMAKSKVEAMKIHMKEECQNLKKILESKSVPSR